jgi:hypothetical protein
MSSPRNIIVVGVPRSGTSLVAGIFVKKGYFVAEDPLEDLRPGDQFNPSGYWESKDLIEANVDILRAVGFPYHNTWMFEPITDEQVGRIARLEQLESHRGMLDSYQARSPWIWKDPRLCYTLEYWWPILEASNPVVFFIRRNPDHVFRSFLRIKMRDHELQRDEVLARLNCHLMAAERAIAGFGIPCCRLTYEQFSSDPEKTAKAIREVSGVPVGPSELGFSEFLNHSGAIGRTVANLELLAQTLPSSWRAFAKRLAPESLMNRLFPGRSHS